MQHFAGEQYAGAGPTYNGADQQFSVMFAFFNGRQLPENIRQDMEGYAHPSMVISSAQVSTRPPIERPLPTPQGFVAAYKKGKIQFSWDSDGSSEGHYRVFCGSRPGRYEVVYPAVGNSLSMTRFRDHRPFIQGQKYYAAIEKVAGNDQSSERSLEIQFTIDNLKEQRPKVPLGLELKVLWASLHAFLSSLHI